MRMDGDILAPQPRLDRRHSVCDRVMLANRPSDYDQNYRWGGGSSDDENISADSPSTTAYFSPMSYGYGASSSMEAVQPSHLTSGQKDGDELRRNSDVMEILRKTRFPPVHGFHEERSPETILEHECDRILWYGRGLSQLCYVRGESRLSDHRPVSSIFAAEVESINHSRIQNMDCAGSQVDIDELLQFSSGYTELSFF
ncbi:hypothetical protein GW17_00059781 [Ensete ventricosum]|nr:hypothetical protein GW17_00059781 [Ensete ventricosum]